MRCPTWPPPPVTPAHLPLKCHQRRGGWKTICLHFNIFGLLSFVWLLWSDVTKNLFLKLNICAWGVEVEGGWRRSYYDTALTLGWHYNTFNRHTCHTLKARLGAQAMPPTWGVAWHCHCRERLNWIFWVFLLLFDIFKRIPNFVQLKNDSITKFEKECFSMKIFNENLNIFSR